MSRAAFALGWCCGALLLGSSSLSAQVVSTELTLEAGLAATTNGGLRPRGDEKADLRATVRPGLRLSRQGSQLSANLDMGADFVSYASSTQDNTIKPSGRGEARATLLDRVAFLDASVDVGQTAADPFVSVSDGNSTDSQSTSYTYRLTPSVSYEFTPRLALSARSEQSGTKVRSDAALGRRTSDTSLRLEQRPLPLGASIELSRQETRYESALEEPLMIEAIRASVTALLFDELKLTATGGHETSEFSLGSDSQPLYGLGVQWSPGPRTLFDLKIEDRFFGRGWDLGFRHRTPFLTLSVNVNRAPVTASSSLGRVEAGTDLAAYLGDILTTRFPDPAERAAVVDKFLSVRGLPKVVAGAGSVFANYAQLQTGASAAVVLVSQRNTVTLSGYSRTLTRLTRQDVDAPFVPGLESNNKQRGVSLGLNHLMSPQLAVDFGVRWSRIVGLDARLGERTTDLGYRIAFAHTLSPDTSASYGLEHSRVSTTVEDATSYVVTTAIFGLRHRF